MSEQTNDAAERSAHVTRGPAAQDSASVVREWREDGKLVACAEGVARMREELERVRAERDAQAARLARLEPWASKARAVVAYVADPFDCALHPEEAETLARQLKEDEP